MGFFDLIKEFFNGTPNSKEPVEVVETDLDSAILEDDILAELKEFEESHKGDETPKALKTVYTPNFEFFNEFNAMHREHQTGALESLTGHNKGQVTIPTGTGKTRIQVSVHIEDMIAKTKQNETGVYVISAHRLALCTQLLEDMIEIAVKCGINFDILYIGSERFNDDRVHFHYKNEGFTKYVANATNTTSKHEVLDAVIKAKANNRHLLVVSTYHSFHKLEYVNKIDVCTYDEAHISLQERFTKNIELIKPKIEREFFFTATRKVLGESFGMNDTEFFGEVLYEKSPKEMIEKGEIVPPRIHSIRVDQEKGDYSKEDYENKTMLYKVVTEGFEEHKRVVIDHSAKPNDIGAKLLVTFRGSKDMFELHNDPMFRQWCDKNEVKVCAVSSTRGDYYNFESMRRSKVIEEMDKLTDDEDAILLHIDILTEGIDLPSITGILPFRDLTKSKLLQNIGRGTRLLKDDREALYSGKIKPLDYESMVKPYCWVLLSEDIFTDHKQVERMEDILYTISTEYNVPYEELSIGDKFGGEYQEDLESILEKDRAENRDRECGLVHTIHNLMCNSFTDSLKLTKDSINNLSEELVHLKDIPQFVEENYK